VGLYAAQDHYSQRGRRDAALLEEKSNYQGVAAILYRVRPRLLNTKTRGKPAYVVIILGSSDFISIAFTRTSQPAARDL